MSKIRKFLRRYIFGSLNLIICITVLTGALVIRYEDPYLVEILRVKTFDLYQRLKPRSYTEQKVVIVDVDEKSLYELGQWPWSRDVLAKLLEELSRYGARVVGFDIIFAEYDRTSPHLLQKKLPGQFRSGITLPNYEEKFASAMKKVPTVLGQSAVHEISVSALETPREPRTSIAAWIGGEPLDYALKLPFLLNNVVELEEAAEGLGVLTLNSEVDGFVRRIPIIYSIDNTLKPALSLEIIRVGLGGKSLVVKMNEGGIDKIISQTAELVDGKKSIGIKTDSLGGLWVYFTLPDTYNTRNNTGKRYISAVDIINRRVDKERLEGTYVIMGTSAVGLIDFRPTSISPRLPGVEVHANAMENILEQKFLEYPVYMKILELVSIILIGFFLLYMLPRYGAIMSLIVLVLVLASLIGISWYSFSQHLILVDVTFPLIIVLGLFMIMTFMNFLRDEAEKRKIRDAFRYYLSHELVEELANDPTRLQLGGERRTMTMLFCDIRGFTTISEYYKDDPIGLTTLINRCLTPLSKSILENQGTIDKYMGDCIMAFWNAPLDDKHHEENACKSAIDMMRGLRAVNVSLESEAKEEGREYIPIRVGIGINTGSCVVGNMGSEVRFDYSVVGDPVNLASRLEGQSKTYGVSILLGEDTVDNMGSEEGFMLLELDKIIVKGKAEAIKVYTMLVDKDMEGLDDFASLKELHDTFLGNYREQKWERSIELGIKLYEGCPLLLKNYYKELRSRIEVYREGGFMEGWDGTYTAQTK